MKNIFIVLLFFVSISLFSQNPIIYDENKLKNWYSGSHAITLSTDKNLNIGWKWTSNSGIYIDLKSNFGAWGNDKPENSNTPNFYEQSQSHVMTMTDNNLVQPNAFIDEFDTVAILNGGYNIPIFRANNSTISLFGGVGVIYRHQVTYDRYVNNDDPSWSSFNGTWWLVKPKTKTNINFNSGLELSFKDGFGGVMIGYDSYTSAINVGITMPIVSGKSTLSDINYIINGIDLREINTFTIEDMINFFILDCKFNGININENQVINAEFVSNLDKSTIAISSGIYNDNLIEIKINDKSWMESTISHRWYILYHELGHDILNLRHGEGGQMMFTRPTKPNYSWEDFLNDKSVMFKNYTVNN